ncbi:MAG TPA: thioredoxin domain-containing protein [Candidatus Dormibacteraeota bacterium]|nr:thioredoxin domain-containing protein [Candidatus Dormibacteraeota bacterium]
MANRLAQETSPYLLEHANNPVDWYPWGEAALARARTEHKPILLSIGYSACHWCHVMARESFEDPQTAASINRDFVAIKVDREERPDLDQVYMRAVQAMTGSGGWPMTVFVLPDGRPFFAGTYFPPSDRFGMPSFQRVLAAVADAFAKRPADVEETAAQVRDFLNRPSVPLAVGELTLALLDEAAAGLARDFDTVHGGFGGAPKFPQPMLVEVLLRHHVRTGQAAALEMALQTLRAMAAGGIHDQLGGGFHRYSIDDHWLVPHFEKMLYDNALLLRAYLDAWQLTHDPAFRRVAEDTVAFVLREMTSPEGGFYSSLDADSQGEEGRFYLWTPQELEAALGADQAGSVAAAFDVTGTGNFEGRNILHPVAPGAIEILDAASDRLIAFREQRVRPHRDEKVIAGWNGLMLRAVADAGRVLDRPDLTTAAQATADFLLSHMRHDGRMRRSYKDGRAPLAGYLEDQAAVADGLLALYEATFDPRWLDEVRGLVSEMVTAFWDPASGAFFDTAQDQERLVARPQDVTDNAIPSGTSLAVDVLLRAGMLLGEPSWVDIARATLERLAPTAAKAPLAFGRLLAALDFHLARTVELAVIGEPADPQTRRLLEVMRERFLPNRLVAVAPGESAIPLLADRRALDGKATAYLCEGFVCQAPTTDPAQLARQLEAFTAKPVASRARPRNRRGC